jgi:hypothetical protein
MFDGFEKIVTIYAIVIFAFGAGVGYLLTRLFF